MAKLKRELLDDKLHKKSNCLLLTVIAHGNSKGKLLQNRVHSSLSVCIENLIKYGN